MSGGPSERIATARPPVTVKPRWRGVLHEYAFFAALAAGAVLVIAAPTGRSTIAMAVYAVAVCGLLGTSAVYHRVNWSTAGARRWMRRLDHSMIFVMIAGTYTPFALLVLEGALATVILVVVWGGALAGVVMQLVWTDAPKWLSAVVYVALGWVALAVMPQIVERSGLAATTLLLAGGLLYTAGAIIYALRRPDPRPAVFGYHEVFHALVVAAAAIHFVAVAGFALPSA